MGRLRPITNQHTIPHELCQRVFARHCTVSKGSYCSALYSIKPASGWYYKQTCTCTLSACFCSALYVFLLGTLQCQRVLLLCKALYSIKPASTGATPALAPCGPNVTLCSGHSHTRSKIRTHELCQRVIARHFDEVHLLVHLLLVWLRFKIDLKVLNSAKSIPSSISAANANSSCCPVRPRTTPFPEKNSILNIWGFTVDWHECCDPTGGVGALCNSLARVR